jgi:hypothetical protein
MRIAALLSVVFLAVAGCKEVTVAHLKDAPPPELAAGWSTWDRPTFKLSAPENWSPYQSRHLSGPLPKSEESDPNAPPAQAWVIEDKEGDENRIKLLGKQGIPLRLFDNSAPRTLTISFEDSETSSLEDEVKSIAKRFGIRKTTKSKLDLPVGPVEEIVLEDGKSQNAPKQVDYVLFHADKRYVIEVESQAPDPNLAAAAREILATFRQK